MELQLPRADPGTEEQAIMSTFYSWIDSALRKKKNGDFQILLKNKTRS
jgi:hypothetical protein